MKIPITTVEVVEVTYELFASDVPSIASEEDGTAPFWWGKFARTGAGHV